MFLSGGLLEQTDICFFADVTWRLTKISQLYFTWGQLFFPLCLSGRCLEGLDAFRLTITPAQTTARKKTLQSDVDRCFHLIYSGRQVCGRTSRGPTGGSHRISPPSAVLALIFIARRIQPSPSLVNREVGLEFCVPTNKSLSNYWA